MNVIGGGPVGLWAAKLAADRGLEVKVHEEHRHIGRPSHCTGLLSSRIDSILEPEVVLHYVNAARFYAGGEEAVIRRDGVARVIDREAFDRQVAEEAMASGAEVETGRRVLWKMFKGDVVAADGARGSTRLDMGQELGFLPAMQFDLHERPEGDWVELWFEDWNPDFFVWVVPRGNRMRVGTASRNLRPLKDFARRRFGRFRPASRSVGLVVTSGPVRRTYFQRGGRRVSLVGDAAGQVKPTTGGGVITGMTCAEKLVEALAAGKPASYERRWRAELGREFRVQRLVRHLMLRNPSGFVRFLQRAGPVLEEKGDMDFQSRVLPRLLWPALPWALGALLPF